MDPSPHNAPAQASVLVAALYRFARLDDLETLRARLRSLCREKGIRGTILLAREGVNGTVAGTDAAVGALVAAIESVPGLAGLELKYSRATTMPFHRMKVRLKAEIVTMGVASCDPVGQAGTYVAPEDWNALIADPDTVVIDTRNGYETTLGTFEGAVDPQTHSFSEFPAWSARNLDRLKARKVAMFCTGGIRCEKATAHMRSLGIEEVFHLKGGILKYLEEVPPEESLWRGECFVFDERVSVGHGLVPGAATLCRACRHPLVDADRASPLFEEGVSCPHCHAARSEEDRRRYRERQKQVEIAQRRGEAAHIGGAVGD